MDTPLQNDVFLRALRRQPVPYTPVWLMRQAGRYLPEYRKSRASAGSFMQLAQNPDFACEVTLQPIDRFDLDAAILFADILLVPDAMDLGLHFEPGQGPIFERPIQSEEDVSRLRVPDMARLDYVFKAVSTIRQALGGRVPLIGFAGSPWTVACYMVEGRSSRDYRLIKSMMYARPDLLHKILQVVSQATALYLIEQAKAGAQALMIFDSWGGVLGHSQFAEFSLAYTRSIIQQVKAHPDCADVPVIAFTKGGGLWLDALCGSGADALGVDWTVNLSEARKVCGDRVALQGNLDPMTLFGTESALRREVRRTLDEFGPVGQGGHVFNLGHGINLHTPPEQVAALVDEVHKYSPQFHKS